MTSRAPPPALLHHLQVPGGSCFHHCLAPVRPHPLRVSASERGWVYTCPQGAVSTVVITGGARAPDAARVLRFLRARTAEPQRVVLSDLRSATRRGPELGRSAEQFLARHRAAGPIRLLYWRLYPSKEGHRVFALFGCFRHGVDSVRFFVAESAPRRPACPFCSPSADHPSLPSTSPHRSSGGRSSWSP